MREREREQERDRELEQELRQQCQLERGRREGSCPVADVVADENIIFQ